MLADVIIIIIIIIIIAQDIYNYSPKTDHVSRVYSVASLLFRYNLYGTCSFASQFECCVLLN